MFFDILQNPGMAQHIPVYNNDNMLPDHKPAASNNNYVQQSQPVFINQNGDDIHQHEAIEESLSIMDKEKELIIKALKKHNFIRLKKNGIFVYALIENSYEEVDNSNKIVE